jgi:hypothetical protein
MGIEFTNYTDKQITIDLFESALREGGKFPLLPGKTFTVEPSERGEILDWIPRAVPFGLDNTNRSLRAYLTNKSQTIHGLGIRFTPVSPR